MRKICSYPGCNTPVEVDDLDRSSPRCPQHPLAYTPKKIYSHQHDHTGKVIYGTYKWKKLRKAYKDEHPLCEDCLIYDIHTPVAVVDHVIELEDGGDPYDPANFRSLCHTCHNRKTARERKKRNKSNGFKSMNDF